MDRRILDALNSFYAVRSRTVVDEITEPGIVRILAGEPPVFPNQPPEIVPWIREKAKTSVRKHNSKHALVAGHMHCAGNAVPDIEHYNNIRAATETVWAWNLFETVVGLWAYEVVGGKWGFRVISEYAAENRARRIS